VKKVHFLVSIPLHNIAGHNRFDTVIVVDTVSRPYVWPRPQTCWANDWLLVWANVQMWGTIKWMAHAPAISQGS